MQSAILRFRYGLLAPVGNRYSIGILFHRISGVLSPSVGKLPAIRPVGRLSCILQLPCFVHSELTCPAPLSLSRRSLFLGSPASRLGFGLLRYRFAALAEKRTANFSFLRQLPIVSPRLLLAGGSALRPLTFDSCSSVPSLVGVSDFGKTPERLYF